MANYSTGKETKKKIIQAAQQLFYEKGYRDTTYADICKAVGIKQGNLHYHFNSKEVLCREVAARLYSLLRTEAKMISNCSENQYLVIVIIMYLFWYKFFHDENIRRFALETATIYVNENVYDYFENYLLSIGSSRSKHSFLDAASCLSIDERLPIRIVEYTNELSYIDAAEYLIGIYSHFLGPEQAIMEATIKEARSLLMAADLGGVSMSLGIVD